jgi:hypothetical protein
MSSSVGGDDPRLERSQKSENGIAKPSQGWAIAVVDQNVAQDYKSTETSPWVQEWNGLSRLD